MGHTERVSKAKYKGKKSGGRVTSQTLGGSSFVQLRGSREAMGTTGPRAGDRVGVTQPKVRLKPVQCSSVAVGTRRHFRKNVLGA